MLKYKKYKLSNKEAGLYLMWLGLLMTVLTITNIYNENTDLITLTSMAAMVNIVIGAWLLVDHIRLLQLPGWVFYGLAVVIGLLGGGLAFIGFTEGKWQPALFIAVVSAGIVLRLVYITLVKPQTND